MDLILRLLLQKTKTKKPQRNTKETSGGDGCIFCFDCGDGFTSMCMHQPLKSALHVKYAACCI